MNWNTTFGFRQTLSFLGIQWYPTFPYHKISSTGISLSLSIYLQYIHIPIICPLPTYDICINFHHLSNQSQLVTWVHELPHPRASPVPVLPPWEAVLNPVLGWTRLQQQQPWISMWDVHGGSHLQHGFNLFPKTILENHRVAICFHKNHWPLQSESNGVKRHFSHKGVCCHHTIMGISSCYIKVNHHPSLLCRFVCVIVTY